MIYQMILVKLLLLRCCFSLVHRPVVPVPILNHDVAYASYWERLLLEEHDDTVKDLRERRKQWSRQKLESTGLSIFGATAEPDSEAYGEKIVRIVKVGETLLQDRFTRGDVLLLTPLSGAEEDCVPRECLIIDVGKDWMTAGVGPNWPDGLWEARKYPGAFQVRLDRTAPQAPLRAQRKALDLLRKGKAGEVASLLARFFDHPNGSEQLANLTSRMPSHFSSTTTIEKVIWDALDATLSQSSFKPNQSQKDVIVWSLQRRISLIRGPPGTGASFCTTKV